MLVICSGTFLERRTLLHVMDSSRLNLLDPEDWQLAAACRGRQDLFFAPDDPPESRVERKRREAKAKSICGICVVRVECLDEAIRTDERHGVWGGMTERERRAAARKKSLSPPQDIARPGRPVRLPAVVVRGRAVSPGPT